MTEWDVHTDNHADPGETQNFASDDISLTGSTSPGVRRMEAVSRHFDLSLRIVLFVGVFIVAYIYSLDISLRYAYQPTATDSFSTHSLLATISVLRNVIAAAAQPLCAKTADVFGRVELLLLSIFFYVLGTIVDATSHNIEAYSAGAVIYQIGYTCVTLLVDVILSDVTSLRARLFFSYLPVSPFLINAWVSGDVAESALNRIGWRWGVGMWAIIYPISTLPLLFALMCANRRAKNAGDLAKYKTPYQKLGTWGLAKGLFWQLDIVGMVLMLAILSLILTPLTLAGGISSSWRQAHVIAPLVVGILCIPAFAAWESRAPHPMVPLHLLKDRMVWGPLGIITFMNCAAACQGDFLYTVLVVSFNQSVLSATRITNLYSFTSCLAGIFVGLVVFKIRRLKWIIVSGACLHLAAFGLLIEYRGGSGSNYAGMISAQLLLGVSCGMFTYAALALMQSATRHEHLAVVTGVYFACFNIGGAMGNAISGALWTQLLPGRLLKDLGVASITGDVYNAPLTEIENYPWGSPVRNGIVDSYRHVQRILCITGISIASLVVFCALVLRDPRLPDEQSMPEEQLRKQSARYASSERE